jgi:hypothetical protein
MAYTVITLNKEIFDQLLKHAPAELRRQAKDDAERAIVDLCFTEANIWHHCEQDERWKSLSPEAQAAFEESLLDCGDYEHATETASEAIAEAVEHYLDEELSSP